MYYLKELSPQEAAQTLDNINPIMLVLATLKAKIEPINDITFRNFRTAALEFCEVMELLETNLNDIAEIHGSYKQSLAVLAEDWNSEADNHWDNY